MDAAEQIASAHESLVELLRAIDPRVLIRIVCANAGIVVRDIVQVRERTPKFEISGLSKAAKSYAPDLVFTVHTADGRVLTIWVFEAQLSKDWLKRRRWALYPVAYAAEYNKDALLAVFAPIPELREWLRIKLIPRIEPRPLLIEPDQIERITDYCDARRRPELTVLGCLYHGHAHGRDDESSPSEQQVAVIRAAFVALQTLAGRESQRYSVLVMSIVQPSAVRQALEELRESGDIEESRYELFSDSERLGHSFHRGFEEGRLELLEELLDSGAIDESRYEQLREIEDNTDHVHSLDKGRVEALQEGLEEGRQEGRQEGRRELLHRAIIDILELRGFVVTQATRARIQMCPSLETLERWYAAVKATAANQTLEQLLD